MRRSAWARATSTSSSADPPGRTHRPLRDAFREPFLARWPGLLIEYYGMTEGGGTCILQAHLHPTKLHTVGQPSPGHVIKIIDEDGNELPQGEVGEIVGHSPIMMNGYHNQPGKTPEQVVVPTGTPPPLFINDLDRIYYQGIAPAPPSTPKTSNASAATASSSARIRASRAI